MYALFVCLLLYLEIKRNCRNGIISSLEAHLNSGVRLLVELYCVIVIKHVAFFTICATSTMAFTFTSLLLNYCTSLSGCGCGFVFEQKHRQINGFGHKKARIGGFCIPLSTPLYTRSSLCNKIHHLSSLGLATINLGVLTGFKIYSGYRNDVQA